VQRGEKPRIAVGAVGAVGDSNGGRGGPSEQNPVESSRAANILTLFDTLLLVDCFGFPGKLFFLEHKP